MYEAKQTVSITQPVVVEHVTTFPQRKRCPYLHIDPCWWLLRHLLPWLLIPDASTSTKGFQYDVAASLPTSEGGRRLFDTHAVVRLFEGNGLPLFLLHKYILNIAVVSPSHILLKYFTRAGFTTRQAEAMVKILLRMTQSNMDVIYGDMVTKVQQVRCARAILAPQRCGHSRVLKRCWWDCRLYRCSASDARRLCFSVWCLRLLL